MLMPNGVVPLIWTEFSMLFFDTNITLSGILYGQSTIAVEATLGGSTDGSTEDLVDMIAKQIHADEREAKVGRFRLFWVEDFAGARSPERFHGELQ